jgi:hypothetical protein
MSRLKRSEFLRIAEGIRRDREAIIKHNPMGSDEEVLLWMLMSCLINYLGLEGDEVPCFPGPTNSETYKKAIMFIVANTCEEEIEFENVFEGLID